MLDLFPIRDIQEDSVESSRKRVGTIAAGIFVALIVVLGIVLAVMPHGDKAGEPALTAPQPAVSQGSRPVQSASPTLPAPSKPLETAIPSSPPKGVTWSLFQGVALPSSRTDGPSRIEGPVYAGYSHTPTGALLAATQISVRGVISPDGGWKPVLEQQALPGPGRDALASKLSADSSPSGSAQIVGFHFVTYSSDVAVIQVAVRAPSGGMATGTTTVRWSEGDWKLEVQPDGSTSTSTQALTSLYNFVPWGGVG